MRVLCTVCIFLTLMGCKESDVSNGVAAKPNYYGTWVPYTTDHDTKTYWCTQAPDGSWDCPGTTTGGPIDPLACQSTQAYAVSFAFTIVDATKASNGWGDTSYTFTKNVIKFMPVTNVEFTVDFYDETLQTAVITSSPGCSLMYVKQIGGA